MKEPFFPRHDMGTLVRSPASADFSGSADLSGSADFSASSDLSGSADFSKSSDLSDFPESPDRKLFASSSAPAAGSPAPAPTGDDAWAMALRLLAHGAQSTRMLREKLIARGVARERAAWAADRAAREGLIHEQRLMESYVWQLAHRRCYGVLRIRREVRAKFDADSVEAYLDGALEEIDFEALALSYARAVTREHKGGRRDKREKAFPEAFDDRTSLRRNGGREQRDSTRDETREETRGGTWTDVRDGAREETHDSIRDGTWTDVRDGVREETRNGIRNGVRTGAWNGTREESERERAYRTRQAEQRRLAARLAARGYPAALIHKTLASLARREEDE